MIRNFRLTNDPGGLGLSCTPAGLSLAGVPLLRKTEAGFAPRPAHEIASLIEEAYGAVPTRLQSSVDLIAEALNRGDFARAMIAAVLTWTLELDREAARRLASAESKLVKYDPNEPRDWHGRWTRDKAADPSSIAAPAGAGAASEAADAAGPRSSDSTESDAEWHELLTPDAFTLSDDEQEDDEPQAPTPLQQTFERKYDDLGPVGFAKEAIQFGDRLGREGKNFSLDERERARSPNIPFFKIASPSGSATTTNLRAPKRI